LIGNMASTANAANFNTTTGRPTRVTSTSKTQARTLRTVVSGGDSIVTSSNQGGKPSTRRDVLIRQPSYCKILDDLKGTEAKFVGMKQENVDSHQAIEVSTSAETDESGEALGQQQVQTITINGQQYQIVSPSAIASDGGIQTITVGGVHGGGVVASSSASSSPSGVVQYAATSQNGQTVFIPGTVAAAAASGPQIISVATGSVAGSSGGSTIEEATRKREVRLLKNREAARECRNKKKEYIKCLENRVGELYIIHCYDDGL
jgi:hypothetical protein